MTSQPYTMRLGPLQRLPREYVGERHVAIVKQLPSDSSGFEQYEFEERPGPGPKLTFGDKAGPSITVFLVSPDQ